jgi:hypothetical protein
VGAGFGEVVYQRSGVIGERIEFDSREVPFGERPRLIEEDGGGVLGVLDRLDGLVATRHKVKVNKIRDQKFDGTHLEQYPLLRSNRHSNENHHRDAHD